MTKTELPKLPEDFDHKRLFRFQAPMLPKRVTFQQFVVGWFDEAEQGLWLLTDVLPPQFAPVNGTNYRFQVFVIGQEHDMNALAQVWYHMTKYQQTIPQLYSLDLLGIQDLHIEG